MQISKSSNYSNISFKGWNIYSTCFAEKSKAIAKIAKERGKEAADKCVKLFDELGSNSPHYHLYIDESQYAVFGHHICSSSFLKTRRNKSFPAILNEMKSFMQKEAPKIEKAENFKKRISPILLAHGKKIGWHGDIVDLKDKLAADVALSVNNFKVAKNIYHSLNRINRVLNQKNLFIDVSSDKGDFLFEISDWRYNELYSTRTRNSSIPFVSKIPLVSKSAGQCLRSIEKFLCNYQQKK